VRKSLLAKKRVSGKMRGKKRRASAKGAHVTEGGEDGETAENRKLKYMRAVERVDTHCPDERRLRSKGKSP